MTNALNNLLDSEIAFLKKVTARDVCNFLVIIAVAVFFVVWGAGYLKDGDVPKIITVSACGIGTVFLLGLLSWGFEYTWFQSNGKWYCPECHYPHIRTTSTASQCLNSKSSPHPDDANKTSFNCPLREFRIPVQHAHKLYKYKIIAWKFWNRTYQYESTNDYYSNLIQGHCGNA